MTLVCCEGRYLCVGLITRPEESYRLTCVSDCDGEASIMRRPWPTTGCCVMTKNLIIHALPHSKQQCMAKTKRSVLFRKNIVAQSLTIVQISTTIPSCHNSGISVLMKVVRIVSNTSYRVIFTCLTYFNLLKPTGYVMHQQFNIQQLYVLPTLYLCVLYLSENKQRLVPLTA